MICCCLSLRLSRSALLCLLCVDRGPAPPVHHSSCSVVSALTADLHDHASLPAAPAPKRKKKKSAPVWKMQPIDTSAYVPLPEQAKGVETR